MQLKVILLALAVFAAPTALAQSKPTYFVVDASGSMNEDNQADAKAILQGLSLPRDRLISVTYFGGKPSTADADLCVEDLEVPELQARGADFSPRFPPLGSGKDKTAIGHALEAVLRAKKGEGTFVLITDGLEECVADYAATRTRYPRAEILVRQVGKTQNAALQLLEIQPEVERASEAASPLLPVPLPVSLVPPNPEPEAAWPERLFWVVLVAVSALAATLLCLQSGERTKSLQDQLTQLENKTSAELADLYKPTKVQSGKEVRMGDAERFSIFWARDREGSIYKSYGIWAVVFLVVSALGWLCLAFRELGLVAFPETFFDAVRHDAWEFLNSNIGAYSFAGTIIALIGFSAFQWWQTLEAKKQLMIRSGIIAGERAGIARRMYDRARRAILSIRFELPSRYNYLLWSSERVEISGFDALQATLLNLAAPPFEDATAKRKREIQSFENLRDPHAFASLLKREGQLRQHQLDQVAELLKEAKQGKLSEAADIVQKLLEELAPQAAIETEA